MRKRLGFAFGIALIGARAIIACVGDNPSPAIVVAPDSATNTPATNPTTTPTTTNDGGPGGGDPDTGATTDPGICTIFPTAFQCGDGQAPFVCYDDQQSCQVTSCDGLFWQCDSPHQCSGAACCIPKAFATLKPGANCLIGTLAIGDAGPERQGTTCAEQDTCGADDVQMCNSDVQCPTGQHCKPVNMIGGPHSLSGVHFGACAP